MSAPAVIPAVVEALMADATLAGLVPGGWWHDAAPAGTARPFGIVEMADSLTSDGELEGRVGFWRGTVSLRVVVDGNARAAARTARNRAVAVITAAAALDGWTVADAWFAADLEGLEVDDGTRVWSNAGALVELALEA